MRFCTNCGNQLLEHQKFCTKCGTPVANDAGPGKSGVYRATPETDPDSGRRTGGSGKPPRKGHKVRNILIAGLAVVLCGGGAFAAWQVNDKVLMNSGRIVAKTSESISEVNNFGFNLGFNLAVSGMGIEGEDGKMSFNFDTDISPEKGIGHCTLTIFESGDEDSVEFYAQKSDNMTTLYINDSGWVKQSYPSSMLTQFLPVNADDLKKTAEDMLRSSKAENTEYNGVDALLITQPINVTIPEQGSEWILDILLYQIADEMNITTDIIRGFFSDIPPINASLYINRDTYLPIRLELDGRECVNKVVGNIVSFASSLGEVDPDDYVNLIECGVVVDFKDFNQSDVNIPAEAQNGRDLGVADDFINEIL